MAKRVRGYLSKTGTFYETEDEADYHDFIYELETRFMEYAHAYEVPDEGRERLSEFFFNFVKANAETLISLLQCYQRLNPSDGVAGQLDEGGEGLREPLRSGDIDPVEGSPNAQDTIEQPSEEDGGGDGEELRRGQPSGEGEATEAVVGSKYKKGDRPNDGQS